VYVRQESWRNILYDRNAKAPDLRDSRYMFRWKWLDLDVAKAMFPSRSYELEGAAISSEMYGPEQDEDIWYLGQRLQERDSTGQVISRRSFISDAFYVVNRRERVRIIEGWYKMPISLDVMRGYSRFDGMAYEAGNPVMKHERETGIVTLEPETRMMMHVALFTEDHLIAVSRSPYRHNRFPFTPIFAYRRSRDGLPYGMVRAIRGPQEDLNKRASKALHIVSTRGVLADKGAFSDPEEAREELARPDYFLEKNPGKEVEIKQDLRLAETEMRLMEMDGARMRQSAGVTGENLGLETNAVSGRAINSRQTQGGIVTTELFDNERYAAKISGQKVLSLIEQFVTDEQQIRIVGEKQAQYVKINRFNPETEQIENDIAATMADFTIGEQDYQQSLRNAMFEAMMDMASKMSPEVSLKFLDLVFEMSDLPNRQEMARRIRSISGVQSPGEKLTPDEQKAMADAKQKMAKQEALNERLTIAQLEKLVGEGAALIAKARKTQAEVVETNMSSVKSAMEAGVAVAQVPESAPIADELLKSGGYIQDQPPAGVP
jgi:hypothetical protein